MTRLCKNNVRRLRSLAAVVVFVSLPVFGFAPAGAAAESSEPGYLPEADACIGAAEADVGFVDVPAGGVFFAAINCLAHYRITVGCGDGAGFCPARTVTRREMALFLRRAARVAGVQVDASEGAAFADIPDSYPAEWSAAITDLARAGIMPGVSDAAFDPGGVVSREDMAVFLANFVDHASDVVTRVDGAGAADTFVLGVDRRPPGDSFCDIDDAGLAADAASAVGVIYELGITVGRDARSGECSGERIFDPAGLVTRSQMAAFITRTLNHTNARPAGVTAQTAGANIVISVRDNQHHPVANLSVDVFYTLAGGKDQAFGRDGGCSRRVTAAAGAAACEIDRSDPRTLIDGNVALRAPAGDGRGVAVWVWAGPPGATFDEMTTSRFEVALPGGATP